MLQWAERDHCAAVSVTLSQTFKAAGPALACEFYSAWVTGPLRRNLSLQGQEKGTGLWVQCSHEEPMEVVGVGEAAAPIFGVPLGATCRVPLHRLGQTFWEGLFLSLFSRRGRS